MNRGCCPHPFSDATMTALMALDDVSPRETEGDTFNKCHCPLSQLCNYMQIKQNKALTGKHSLIMHGTSLPNIW